MTSPNSPGSPSTDSWLQFSQGASGVPGAVGSATNSGFTPQQLYMLGYTGSADDSLAVTVDGTKTSLKSQRIWFLNQGLQDSETVRKWQNQLIQAGLLDPTDSGYYPGVINGQSDPTYHAFDMLLKQAESQGLDVSDVLAADAATYTKDNNLAKSKDVKTTAVQTTNAGDAQMALDKAFQSLLGRHASAAEVTAFQSSLAQQEQANPQVSDVQTSTSPADANLSGAENYRHMMSGSTQATKTEATSGGVNVDASAENTAKTQFSGEYMQNSQNNFMGALLGLLGMSRLGG